MAPRHFAMLFLAFVALFLMANYAWPADNIIIVHRNKGECGNPAEIAGCFRMQDGACHVYANDYSTQQHETQHCLGGRHSQWVPVNGRPCATVTDAGYSSWVVGRIMCRREDGDYVFFDS